MVIQDNALWFWVITIFTIFTILYALVNAINLRKRGRLDLKQKICLLISYLFQVASRLTLITASSSYTIDDVNGQTSMLLDVSTDFGLYNLFYVFAPFFIHWVLLYIIYLLPIKSNPRN